MNNKRTYQYMMASTSADKDGSGYMQADSNEEMVVELLQEIRDSTRTVADKLLMRAKGLSDGDMEYEQLNLEEEERELSATEEEEEKEWVTEAVTNYEIYMESVNMEEEMREIIQDFITVLGDSSLTIKEQNKSIRISSTYLEVNSEDIHPDLGPLFEANATNVPLLSASLVYASIFIPAMVVKFYRTFSTRQMLQLVSARTIALVRRATVGGVKRKCILNIPRGEIQYLRENAAHLQRETKEWLLQLTKPMRIKLETRDETLQTLILGFNWKYMCLMRNYKRITYSDFTQERAATMIAEIRHSFNFYAKNGLSQKSLISLSQTAEGIKSILSNGFSEKIRQIITVSRILVFQESLKARFVRAKMLCLNKKPDSNQEINIMELRMKFVNLLSTSDPARLCPGTIY